jgi:hypothetical protein
MTWGVEANVIERFASEDIPNSSAEPSGHGWLTGSRGVEKR